MLLYRKTLPTQLSVFFESDSNFDSGQNSKERDLSQNFVSRLFSLKEKNFLPFSFFIDLYYMYLCTLSHKLFLKCEKVFEYQTQRVQNFQDGFTSSLSICKNTFGKYYTFIGFDSFWILNSFKFPFPPHFWLHLRAVYYVCICFELKFFDVSIFLWKEETFNHATFVENSYGQRVVFFQVKKEILEKRKITVLPEICGFVPCFLLWKPSNPAKRSMKAFVQQNNVLELQRLELKSHNSPKPFSFSSKVPQIKGLSD